MSGQVVDRTTAPGEVAASIYDLGYQHYAGARLGRRAAFLALYTESLRGCFGLGRPTRSKVVPFGLLILAELPAVIAVALEAFLGGVAGGRIENPIRYDNYFPTIVQFLVLFVAAQAPEMVGRDQRYHVLSLYFSRALDRLDYAVAKVVALVSALLVLSLLPQATIFVGKVLGSQDLLGAFTDNLAAVPAIVLSAATAALVMASLALAVAAFTPRRAYATAAIFALFYITLTAVAIAGATLHGDLARYVLLVAPTNTLEVFTAWLFGTAVGPELARADLAGPDGAAAAAAMAAGALVVLAWRYRGIGA